MGCVRRKKETVVQTLAVAGAISTLMEVPASVKEGVMDLKNLGPGALWAKLGEDKGSRLLDSESNHDIYLLEGEAWYEDGIFPGAFIVLPETAGCKVILSIRYN